MTILEDLLLGGGLAVPQHNVYLDRLAPARIRNTDRDGLLHFGVLKQRLFNVSWIDVHAAGDDHVFLAIDDREVAAFVDAGEVARKQPSIAQHPRGFVRSLPVPAHDLRPAHRQLAHLARRQVPRASFLIEDSRVGRRHRNANRAN